ncbi:MAG: FtsQ-type POTRA domain-containing protein [Deltaproteobacteria bacterium]|jgi:cell division protein FtsQ|nr:FtsQ-type POTRA domain-containing protein [Deltaproteobacteria bacterium]
MNDLKRTKKKKVKQNRRKQERPPCDWKKISLRCLRITVAVVTGFMMTCGVLLSGQMILESGYFSISQVQVERQVRVGEEEILEASDIQVGDSLFDLDLHMIGRKIEEHPWVAKADVERVFPDQVVIRITEREPRAIVDLGYLYYVDDDGVVFKVLGSEDQLDFPVITGIDRQSLLEDSESVENSIKMALALMNALEQGTLFNLKHVSEIHYEPQEGLTLYTYRGGVPVYLGGDNFENKLKRLEHIFPDLEPRLTALSYIDLNVADRVIVKIDVKRTVDHG